MIVPIAVYLLALFTTGFAGEKHWTYGKDGEKPDSGWESVSETCDDKSQSPIDITGAEPIKYDPPLKLGTGFSFAPKSFTITNNGHTVSFVPSEWGPNGAPTMTGGPLGDNVYTFNSFHMHWGCKDKQGSEHTIDGSAFDMELHLVFTKGDLAFIDALKEKDGLSVIGLLFSAPAEGDTVTDNDNIIKMNNWIQKMNDESATEYTTTEEETDLFTLFEFFGEDPTSYFSYPGSLTTPPCSEAVKWIVIKDPIAITEETLNVLRGQNGEEADTKLCDNFRETQLLNGRTVNENVPDLAE